MVTCRESTHDYNIDETIPYPEYRENIGTLKNIIVGRVFYPDPVFFYTLTQEETQRIGDILSVDLEIETLVEDLAFLEHDIIDIKKSKNDDVLALIDQLKKTRQPIAN